MDCVQSFCVLDQNNVIVYVGGDWDRFAHENGGRAATGAQVSGRALLSCVRGPQTRAFLAASIAAVRETGKQFVMHYRCDSPGIRRFMRMTVVSLRAGRVLMLHDFLAEDKVGTTQVSPLFADRADVVKCPLCCSVLYGQIWMDPFLPDEPHSHHVHYEMCPDCRGTAGGLLKSSVAVADPDVVVRFARPLGGGG
jgi:hypothetical protein